MVSSVFISVRPLFVRSCPLDNSSIYPPLKSVTGLVVFYRCCKIMAFPVQPSKKKKRIVIGSNEVSSVFVFLLQQQHLPHLTLTLLSRLLLHLIALICTCQPSAIRNLGKFRINLWNAVASCHLFLSDQLSFYHFIHLQLGGNNTALWQQAVVKGADDTSLSDSNCRIQKSLGELLRFVYIQSSTQFANFRADLYLFYHPPTPSQSHTF